jgi:thiosulfate/3-mercaptopyruvate sulfurtransferase
MMNRRAVLLGAAAMAVSPLVSRAASTPEASPAADEWAHPDWLVAPEAFDASLSHKMMFGSAQQYLDGHLDFSDRLDYPDLDLETTDPDSIASWADKMVTVMLNHGISLVDPVSIIDYGTLYAARLFWVLTYLGSKQQVILDGGFPAWKAAGGAVLGGPVTIDYMQIPRPDLKPNTAVLAPIDKVVAAVDAGAAQLIDARSKTEYAEGHIPGAINISYLDNSVDSAGGAYKAPAELRDMYAAAGVDLEKPIIPYCSTGVRSAATWFTLSALGAADVSLFTGSWREWTSDPSRPVEK